MYHFINNTQTFNTEAEIYMIIKTSFLFIIQRQFYSPNIYENSCYKDFSIVYEKPIL